jgi:energy-coupling factor transporter ATPase
VTGAEPPLIRVEDLHHVYQAGTRRAVTALRGIDLTIGRGEYMTLIGANGSGKSTLLRHLNALLLPTSGDVWVAGWNTREEVNLRDIRSTVGMVFQVPDSQIVATVVEEDVAFGPENLSVPQQELRRRVDWALDTVGLSELRHRASHLLSAGQKQRLAIASALAMSPRCLLLDEATAMLDPAGRQQVLLTIGNLHRSGLSIISATHSMAEAAMGQRVVVLSEGRIALDGKPRVVFGQFETLRSLELEVPQATLLARELTRHLSGFPADLLTVSEVVDAVTARLAQPARGSG